MRKERGKNLAVGENCSKGIAFRRIFYIAKCISCFSRLKLPRKKTLLLSIFSYPLDNFYRKIFLSSCPTFWIAKRGKEGRGELMGLQSPADLLHRATSETLEISLLASGFRKGRKKGK